MPNINRACTANKYYIKLFANFLKLSQLPGANTRAAGGRFFNLAIVKSAHQNLYLYNFRNSSTVSPDFFI
jgi:hypothetical protein